MWGVRARPMGQSQGEVPGVVALGREASSGGEPVSSLAGTQVQRSRHVPKSQRGHGNSESDTGRPLPASRHGESFSRSPH